jgi:hypothetical protein
VIRGYDEQATTEGKQANSRYLGPGAHPPPVCPAGDAGGVDGSGGVRHRAGAESSPGRGGIAGPGRATVHEMRGRRRGLLV